MHRLAGIELGGTNTVVVLGHGGRIVERAEFATGEPEETLARAIGVIEGWREERAIDAVGIASFGPIRVAREAPDYGTMLDTPKVGWSGTQVLAPLATALSCPIGLDTDVNVAALAEHLHGAAQGCSSLVYLTIGTGIGGGVLIDGEAVHGRLHPEIGHMRLRRAKADAFAGTCAFHDDCIEGLLSGPALAARMGTHPARVQADDPRWEGPAHDLAELLAHLILVLAPQRIVVGGGVALGQPHLLPAARARVPRLLGGYLRDCSRETLAGMIVPPDLGDDAGPIGALAIAARALARRGAPSSP